MTDQTLGETTTTAASLAELEDAVWACVRQFYDAGLADPLLGPVFGAIPDLEGHLVIVQNFWSKALLGTARYNGMPYGVHAKLPVELEHFDRWLALFSASARANLPAPLADRAIAKAEHMSASFKAGIFPFKGADGRPSRLPG